VNLSLRMKGLLALAVLVIYVAAAALYLTMQRRELYSLAQQAESHRALLVTLEPTFNALAHTLVRTQEILTGPDFSAESTPRYSQIALNLTPLLQRLGRLRALDDEIAGHIDTLAYSVGLVRDVPSGRNLERVRDAEQRLIAHLHDNLSTLDHRTEALQAAYRAKQQFITLAALAASAFGALASAAVILIFFTRLADDIEGLRERAHAIVSGYSGPPMPNRRNDEVGALIEAVNRMQCDLRHSERQQEIHRQQRFHQEKMAAVGSMASVIGHEVSNPIAAIAGAAQYLVDETRSDATHRISQLAQEFGTQIVRQTERISLILRQLATLTQAHSPGPELLDLNSLAQSTCSFIAFDKRFRGIEFDLELDRGLPAVMGVTDHLTQVLMNLLINAADALEDVPKDGAARIRVTTARIGNELRLEVADTGHGMAPEVLARAFEESFSTKPSGRGRGIGLYLCKTLIEKQGGRIELASIPADGTTASLYLPMDSGPNPEV
jgi:signal transduction histidine kinase